MPWDRVDKYNKIVVPLFMGRKKQIFFIHCRKVLGGTGHSSPPQAVLCSTRTLGLCCGSVPGTAGTRAGPGTGLAAMGRDDPSRPVPSHPVPSHPVPSLCHGTHIGEDRDPGRHSLRSERPRVYLLVREKHSTRCHGLGTLRRMPPGQEPVLPQ